MEREILSYKQGPESHSTLPLSSLPQSHSGIWGSVGEGECVQQGMELGVKRYLGSLPCIKKGEKKQGE